MKHMSRRSVRLGERAVTGVRGCVRHERKHEQSAHCWQRCGGLAATPLLPSHGERPLRCGACCSDWGKSSLTLRYPYLLRSRRSRIALPPVPRGRESSTHTGFLVERVFSDEHRHHITSGQELHHQIQVVRVLEANNRKTRVEYNASRSARGQVAEPCGNGSGEGVHMRPLRLEWQMCVCGSV